MADQKRILDLDHLISADAVLIDSVEYDLLTADMLAPLDGYVMQTFGDRVEQLMKQSELSDEERLELERLPDRICRLVLDAPDTVLQKLTTRQRMAVMATFTERTRQARLLTETAQRMAERAIGERASPDSPGSTAGTH